MFDRARDNVHQPHSLTSGMHLVKERLFTGKRKKRKKKKKKKRKNGWQQYIVSES